MARSLQARLARTPHSNDSSWPRAYEPMHFFILFILLTILSSTFAHAASPSMSSYLDCAKSIGVAINDKFTILPGERSGAKGLYVYTDRSAFFLVLGAAYAENADARDFFVKTALPNVGDVFIGFHEEKPEGKLNNQQGISYQTTTPAMGVLGKYRFTPAKETLDEGAKEVMSKRLKAKVASIKDFLDDKNSYSTPAEAKAAFESDRRIYREKLEKCRIEEDRPLNWAVSEEVQKLDSGLPGVTIWEKQIGGKVSAGRTR